MSNRLLLAAMALTLSSAMSAPASAQRGRDQDTAYQEAQRGKIMPLRKVEQRAREHPSTRGATYLGPQFDAGTGVYRFKFMQADRVIWVDVDARDGRVLQTSGD